MTWCDGQLRPQLVERCPKCNPPPLTVGIPELFESTTFATFELGRNPSMKRALELAQKLAAGDIPYLLLAGEDTGIGKTHLAAAACHASRHPRPSVFWSVPKLVKHLRQAYDIEGASIIDALTPYEEGPWLLALDDLGTEKRTEWVAEILYEMLDSRYTRRLPTVITTNTPKESIDRRIVSRFRQGLVVCEGKDLRGAKL